MEQPVCPHCGRGLTANHEICPACGGELHQYENSSVTAPVRRQRSLSSSCLFGVALFIPCIFIAGMFMLSHFRRRDKIRRQEATIGTTQERMSPRLTGAQRLNRMRANQDESNLKVIKKMHVKSHSILLIELNPDWSKLSCDERRQLAKVWMAQWDELGGKLIEMYLEGAEAAWVDPANEQVIIQGCD